jgi:hypothetical protein
MNLRVFARRRAILVSALLVLVTGLGVWSYCCPTGTAFEFNCRYRIKEGMTLDEVEAILGPGTEVPSSPVVRCRGSDGQVTFRCVVEGKRLFYWERDGGAFHIGLEGGRVCSKSFWAPTL